MTSYLILLKRKLLKMGVKVIFLSFHREINATFTNMV